MCDKFGVLKICEDAYVYKIFFLNRSAIFKGFLAKGHQSTTLTMPQYQTQLINKITQIFFNPF